MKGTHFFCLCVSLSTSHLLLFSFHLLSCSLSPSCRLGIELLWSRLLTCGRTCLPLGHRAPKASEIPLWKVGGWSLSEELIFLDWMWSIPSPILLSLSDVDPTLCGIERQRPGSLSSALGAQSHGPSFPALPRPSGLSPHWSPYFPSWSQLILKMASHIWTTHSTYISKYHVMYLCLN